MLVVFAVIIGGITMGRLLSSRRLGFIPRLISVIIWLLLLMLGLEVGSDPQVVGGMATLGRSAFCIFACAVVGSIAMSWLLWRYIGRRTPAEGVSTAATSASARTTTPASSSPASEVEPSAASNSLPTLWQSLRGSLVIVGFFVVGCVAGVSGWMPFDIAGAGVSTWVLYALMFCVGITLGHDTSLVGQVRRLDWRMALLPLATAVGTLAGAAFAALMLPFGVADSLAVGAGFGYYSLSSIFIADLRSVELGAVALLCNVMREIFTLLAAPLVARWFGPLAAVSIGGATTFDTTLPIITQSAGRPYAVVSVFHGCMLDLSVPFLVTLFCSLAV